MKPPHFKLEDRKTVIRLLNPNCDMASIDLKDAYMLILIADKFEKLLRSKFDKLLYEFSCLLFGFWPASFVYNKLSRLVTQVLEGKGFLSIIYLMIFWR